MDYKKLYKSLLLFWSHIQWSECRKREMQWQENAEVWKEVTHKSFWKVNFLLASQYVHNTNLGHT